MPPAAGAPGGRPRGTLPAPERVEREGRPSRVGGAGLRAQRGLARPCPWPHQPPLLPGGTWGSVLAGEVNSDPPRRPVPAGPPGGLFAGPPGGAAPPTGPSGTGRRAQRRWVFKGYLERGKPRPHARREAAGGTSCRRKEGGAGALVQRKGLGWGGRQSRVQGRTRSCWRE